MQLGVVVPKLLLWQKHNEVAGSASCKSRMMCCDNFLALANIFGDTRKKSMRLSLRYSSLLQTINLKETNGTSEAPSPP